MEFPKTRKEMWDFECFLKFHELIVGFIINTTCGNWQLYLTLIFIDTIFVKFRFKIPLFFKNCGPFFKNFFTILKESGLWIDIPLFSLKLKDFQFFKRFLLELKGSCKISVEFSILYLAHCSGIKGAQCTRSFSG